MKYNIAILATLLVGIDFAICECLAFSEKQDVAGQIRMIALEPGIPGESTAWDDLRTYAKVNDIDNTVIESNLLACAGSKNKNDVELKKFSLNMLGYLGTTNTIDTIINLSATKSPLKDAATQSALRVQIRHCDTSFAESVVTSNLYDMKQRRYAYSALGDGLGMTTKNNVSRTDADRSFYTNAISVLLLAIPNEDDPQNMILIDKLLSKHAKGYQESEERLLLMNRCSELLRHTDGPNASRLRLKCEKEVNYLNALPQRKCISSDMK